MKTKTLTNTASKSKWIALAILCAAQFVVIMDTSIIGVALPAIQKGLGYSASGLQWIFNAYVIAFGGFLLLGGKLSDVFGPKKIFLNGFGILLVSSLFAGLAWDPIFLNIARAIQGLGAALIAPSALTLLMTIFTDQKELGKAFGFWGAAAAAGGSAGVFLGGVLTDYISWEWVFYVNVPIAVLVMIFGYKYLVPGNRTKGRIDLASALLVTASLSIFVYSLVTAETNGWLSLTTLGGALLSVILFIVFVRIQKKSKSPLLPLSIFKAPNLANGNIIMALMAGAWIPLWFFLNLYLQQVLNYSAFHSGLALLPMTILIMILMVGVTGKLITKYGPKKIMIIGLASLVLSLVLFSQLPVDGNFLTHVLGASLIGATGMSLAYIPATMISMSGVKPEEGGLASGIVNTTYQIGSAIGLAIAVAVTTAVTKTEMIESYDQIDAVNHGFQGAFIIASFIAVSALVFAFKIKK